MVKQPTTATAAGDGRRVLGGEVPPASHNGVRYAVMSCPASGQWKCTCPDYVVRRRFDGTDCKHIRAVKEAQQPLQQQEEEM
ncbi:MAG TPA: SWIM zinc finger family protein [Nitrososphaera sp.]|jgi:uncharacterized Zn finger protein